ncbi:hypothetical protein F5X99DRAFT_423801 [Biscogniauxia marginata]|nr:hypothetical protein F5X99DRAFT_423801 [Biscogniauxia marginata]
MEAAQIKNHIDIIENLPCFDAFGNVVPRNRHPVYTPHMHRESPPGVPQGCYNGVVDGPPPGLVRVSLPTPAPIRRITNNDVSLFSDIVPYFQTGIDENGCPVSIDLTCQICSCRRLEMPGHVAPTEPSEMEQLAVLPCGHMFGMGCIETWTNTQEEAGEEPSCPMCRFSLYYHDGDCGHMISVHPYDGSWSRHRQVPLTLPEGGFVPRVCEFCALDQISKCVRHINNIVFPTSPVGNFRPGLGAQGPSIMRRQAVELRNYVYNMHEWSQTQYLRW